MSENERWLLSYYRASEINGALFFGRVARTVRGPLLVDVTHHFTDEANHANYWTKCLDDMDLTPVLRTAPTRTSIWRRSACRPTSWRSWRSRRSSRSG
ncbi:hypothetical protein ACFQY4_23855 [Catellatospora bangladeshensis]|uniref:hypothetical protein n=1 Tax=Catellatospora bangladeshensis TaxID=310355 RepID=UPI00361C126E